MKKLTELEKRMPKATVELIREVSTRLGTLKPGERFNALYDGSDWLVIIPPNKENTGWTFEDSDMTGWWVPPVHIKVIEQKWNAYSNAPVTGYDPVFNPIGWEDSLKKKRDNMMRTKLM